MANTFAPFGFSQNRGNGSAPTYEQRVRKIASDNATAIFAGDPVTTLSTGYIAQSSPGTTQIAGIFVGCKYLSTALQRTVWSPFWPGSGATGDVQAYIVNDPNAQFVAQVGGSSSTGIVFADIGANVNFAVGTGSTVTGISGAYVNQTTVNTTATLPFRIVGLIENPPGGPGTDSTSAYNWVLVAFNNVDTKSLTGI